MMTPDRADSLRVVARFLDGRLLKGTTRDFSPNKPDFHIYPEGDTRVPAVKVPLSLLKAVFFVRTFEGNKGHAEVDSPDAQGQGRRIRITFKDGETRLGFTVGYAPDRPGFFIVPADSGSNNLRIFVVRTSVAKVEFLPVRETSLSGPPAR